MPILSVLFASFFLAIVNLFMRKSLDAGGTSRAYVTIQMGVACLFSLLVGPLKTGDFACNVPIAVLGLFAGALLACMLSALGKCLEFGPSGLSFAILSSATVMPAVAMALLFGAPHGYVYTGWHAAGSSLTLAGLFWAGAGLKQMRNQRRWLLFGIIVFSLHVAILTLYQWRALLLEAPGPWFTREEIASEWFAPMLYLSAALIQLALFLKAEWRKPSRREWLYGAIGGVANSLCTLFLLQATSLATGSTKSVLFPLFAIGSIVLSNLWSQFLYREKIHWRACQVSACGILIAAVDWKALLG